MNYAAVTAQGQIDAQAPRKDAQVTRHLRQLFDRLPQLASFRLRCDFMVAEVSLVSGSASTTNRRLHVSLMQALVELAECDPEAIALMRGRKFARSLH
jgi:hypothetical protein